MKLHELKLLEQYAKAKKDGIKPFEIRKNDRNFQVGDLVKYIIIEEYIESTESDKVVIKASCDEELCEYFDNRVFKIKYISDYEQKNGYVVFSEEAYYIGDQKMNNFLGGLGSMGGL